MWTWTKDTRTWPAGDLALLSIAMAKGLPEHLDKMSTNQDLALLSIARAKGLPDHLGLHLNSFCDHHGFYEIRFRRLCAVKRVVGQVKGHWIKSRGQEDAFRQGMRTHIRMRMKYDLMWWPFLNLGGAFRLYPHI